MPLQSPNSEKPLSSTPAAPFCVDSAQIRFTLQQLIYFHKICTALQLPCSNSFAFFHTLNKRFAGEACTSPEERIKSAAYYLPLLLLYAQYGGLLFDAAYPSIPSAADFSNYLWALTDPDQLRSEIVAYRFEAPFLCNDSNHLQRVFQTGAEFFHWEERNAQFAELQSKLSTAQPLSDEDDFSFPHNHALAFWDIFLSYYMESENIIKQNELQGRKPSIRELRSRLQLALQLQELHTSYRTAQPANAADFAKFVQQLIDIMNRFCAALPPYKLLRQFWQHYQKQDDVDHFDQINTSALKTDTACAAALVQFWLAPKLYLENRAPIEEQFQKITQCYLEEPLYRFFAQLFQTLEHYPDLQPVAPVYIWRLFHAYKNPLACAKKTLFTGKNSVDFSPAPLLYEFQSNLLSEERTSQKNGAADWHLFTNLEEYFANWNTDHPCEPSAIDLPLNEYIFQRHIRSKLDIISSTSLFGTKLKSGKPLFRGFALVQNALEHMDGELWRQMPRSPSFPVTPEQADHFYQNNMKHSDKVMKHLLERSGALPNKRKKVLTYTQCEEILSLTLLHPAEDAAASLSAWMHTYINNDAILRDYASASEEAFGLVQFAIYRIALSRCAHELSRQLFDSCADMFYTPLPCAVASKIWSLYFTPHPLTWQDKRIREPLPIRNILLPSRRLYYLPYGQAISELCSSSDTFIVQEQDLISYQAILKSPRAAKFLFQLPDLSSEGYHDINSAAKQWLALASDAQDAQFDGIVTAPICADNFVCLLEPFHQPGHSLSDDDILWMARRFAPFTQFEQALRAQTGDHFPLFFCVQAKFDLARDPLTKAVLKVICRWLADDGADAVILSLDISPLDDPAHTDRLVEQVLRFSNTLNACIPVPLFLDAASYSFPNPDAALQNSGADGLITNFSPA